MKVKGRIGFFFGVVETSSLHKPQLQLEERRSGKITKARPQRSNAKKLDACPARPTRLKCICQGDCNKSELKHCLAAASAPCALRDPEEGSGSLGFEWSSGGNVLERQDHAAETTSHLLTKRLSKMLSCSNTEY